MKNKRDHKIKELQVLKDKNLETKHNEELGLSVPKDYFKTSKNRILEEIESQKEVSNKPTKKRFIWLSIAASITVLFTLTIFNKTIFNTFENSNIALDTLKQLKEDQLTEENLVLLNSEDITLTSLFVEDSELDDFIDSQVLEEIIEDNLPLN